MYVEHAYRLPSGDVVGYDIYFGCRDCFPGPGINIYVFGGDKSTWLETANIEDYVPSDDGGADGSGIPINFFEVTDLVQAAKDIGNTELDADGYDSVTAWLEDNGFEMVQSAMLLFAARMKKENEARNG